MARFPSPRAHQRAVSFFSAIILIAMLILPLACASISQKRRLDEVMSNVEATWILEEWHMKGEVRCHPQSLATTQTHNHPRHPAQAAGQQSYASEVCRTLITEEPDELIAHVRICGEDGWVTAVFPRRI
jgi:hypothetical protein